MIIQCPSCGYAAEVEDSKIPSQGTTARCPKCTASFPVAVKPALPAKLCCPKCRLEQEVADTCHGCGLIFAKYIPTVEPHRAVPPTVPNESKPLVPLPEPPLIVRVLQFLLGCASAVIFVFPVMFLLFSVVQKSGIIIVGNDIGYGVLFVMMVLGTNALIVLYSAAVSYNKKLDLSANYLPHMLAVTVISQAIIGGGAIFRLAYAMYAVTLLFFTSFIMLAARRFPRQLFVTAVITLLVMLNGKALTKKINAGNLAVTSILDERSHKQELQKLDKFWTDVFAGRISAEQLKVIRLQTISSFQAGDEITVLEKKILTEKPRLPEPLLEAIVEIFTGTSLASDERVLCALTQLPELPDKIVSRIVETAYLDKTLIALAASPVVTREIMKRIYLRSRSMDNGRGADTLQALYAMAKNVNTPPQVLEYLAGTMSYPLLEYVAANKKAAPELLISLVQSQIFKVAEAAANNPAATAEVKELFRLRTNYSQQKFSQKAHLWKFISTLNNSGSTGKFYVDLSSSEPAFAGAIKIKTYAKFDKQLAAPYGRETLDTYCPSTFAYEQHYIVICTPADFSVDTSLPNNFNNLIYEIRYDKDDVPISQGQPVSFIQSCGPKFDWQQLKNQVCQ